MADVNVRNYIVAALTPLLPKRWKIKGFNSLPDDIAVPHVILVFQRYTRSTIAPRAWRNAEFVLTIVTPKTDPGVADDALDDEVIDLLNAIDQLAETNLTWTTAERGEAGSRPGFDISLTIPIHLDQPVQETP